MPDPRRVGRPKKITDFQLEILDTCWKSGVPIYKTARRIGITPKAAHNAHYKLRMRRALYGSDIGAARTIRW